MNLDTVDISKLPADVRKQFLTDYKSCMQKKRYRTKLRMTF